MTSANSCPVQTLQVLKNELRVEESEKAASKLKAELEVTKTRLQKDRADLGDSKTSIASSEGDDLSPAANMDRMRLPGEDEKVNSQGGIVGQHQAAQ